MTKNDFKSAMNEVYPDLTDKRIKQVVDWVASEVEGHLKQDKDLDSKKLYSYCVDRLNKTSEFGAGVVNAAVKDQQKK